MDWKTFISNMVGSLAWPAAVGFVAWYFSAEFRWLIKSIRKVGAGGVSLEIADLVEQSGERLAQAAQPKASDIKRDYTFAEQHPEAAVLQVFQDVSDVLLRIRDRIPDGRRSRTLNEVVAWLQRNGHIPASVQDSFLTIRRVVSLLKHERRESPLTPSEAVELVRQLAVLTDVFQQVCDRLPIPQTEKAPE